MDLNSIWKRIEKNPCLDRDDEDRRDLYAKATDYLFSESDFEEKALIAAVKIIQYLSKKSRSDIIIIIEDGDFERLSGILLRIIKNDEISVEASLVSGTTLARLILTKKSAEASQSYLELLRSQEQNSTIMTRVCLTEGILSCGDVEEVFRNETLFNYIADFAVETCSSSSTYSFQSFQLLKTLSARVKFAAALSKYNRLIENSLVAMLSVTANNWENPLKGVGDLALEVYENVIFAREVIMKEKFNPFLDDLTERTISQGSWKSKSKYPPLQVLLPKIGVEAALQRYPGLVRDLAQSLTSNHLASAGAAVYRTVLGGISTETFDERVLNVIFDAIVSEDSLVRNATKNHWLNPTVKFLTKNGQYSLKHLLLRSESEHGKAGFFLIRKIERQSGFNEILDEEELNVVSTMYDHKSVEVKSAAFSVLCHTKKKSVIPTSAELEVIKRFLENNLTVDSPFFRQNLLSDFTTLLVRCRDPLVFKCRKNNLQDADWKLIETLHETLRMLFRNCFPGANYQRLITCLELIGLFLDCFFSFAASSGMNKGSGNGNPAQLIRICRAKNLLLLDTEMNFQVLLSASLFYIGSVRELAQKLLRTFRPNFDTIREIARHALKLVRKPKFSDCENGAALFNLVVGWIDLSNMNINDVIRRESKVSSFSEYLVHLYKASLNELTDNVVKFSKENPMHGFLTALRECMKEERSEMLPSGFHVDLIHLLEVSLDAMLKLLSKDEDNASFADMGEAINALVDESTIELSEEHQLILAMAWINVKECALTCGFLVSKFDEFGLDEEAVKKCGRILMGILTRCRHKGAIEATNLAVSQFSTKLLASRETAFNDIPRQMLAKVLEEMKGLHASVTRRSAGLPMLVQKIVSSETRGKEKRLLQLAVDKLVPLAEGSVALDEETRDNPQSHALHVLQALVHDGSLSQEMPKYVGKILSATIKQFSSTAWAVRNAALQLFGALVPRLLGQKKVRDENSALNSMTVQEFFSRYADSVVPILLASLQPGDERLTIVHPALVPILSMTVRISPGISDSDFSPLIDEFKKRFYGHLDCPVINVRKLAARSVISFTEKSRLRREMDEVILKLKSRPKTNMQNGLLYVAKEIIVNRGEELSPDEGEFFHRVLLDSRICPANRFIVLDILESLKFDIRIDATLKARSFEPFHSALLEKVQRNKVDLWANMNEKKICELLLNEETERSNFRGETAVKCSEMIQNSEAKLDLNLLRVDLSPFGVSAEASSLMIKSKVLSQNPNEIDAAEIDVLIDRIERFSDPRNGENARISAAKSIKNLFRVVNSAKLLRCALTLISDEDPDVRSVMFAAADSSGKSALQRLVKTGGVNPDFIKEPMKNERFVQEFGAALANRQLLFEGGEGLNVFKEPVFHEQIYFEALKDSKPFAVNDVLLENARQFITLCRKNDCLLAFSPQWTPQGYLTLVKLYHCFMLINLQDGDDDPNVDLLLNTLESWIIA